MYYLTKREKGKKASKPILITNNPVKAFKTLNKNSLEVLKALAKEPMYASQIAKELKIHEQKVYYYINNLKKAGLVTVTREEEKRGAITKYYSPTANAFGFEIKKSGLEEKEDSKAREFFQEFVNNGVFDGSIAVSAPFNHGPYMTTARDGHTAVHLAMFLGRYCSLPNRFVVKFDTETKAEHEKKRNLIVVGGPATNIITNELNKFLKIKFEWDKVWGLHSSFSGKYYDGEDISIITKITNPWDRSKKIILLSGLKHEGTKASIIAITQYHDKILKKYEQGKDFYCLIKGLDRDGDGKTDDIKVIEENSI